MKKKLASRGLNREADAASLFSCMRKYLRWMLLPGLVLILALFWEISSWNSSYILTITSNATQKILWSHAVSQGDTFIIRYTHSVDRTEVDEVIRVGEKKLIIDSTVFESFGAGLPSTIQKGQKIRRERGKIIIDHMNQPVPRIDLYIGQVIANHTFLFQGETIPLKTLSKPGTSIRFSVSKENLLKGLVGG